MLFFIIFFFVMSEMGNHVGDFYSIKHKQYKMLISLSYF